MPPPRHPAVRGPARPLLRNDPVPLPRVDLHDRRAADRRAPHGRSGGLREARLPPTSGGARDGGRVGFPQAPARAGAAGADNPAPPGGGQPGQPPPPAGRAAPRLLRPGPTETPLSQTPPMP